MKSSIVLSIHLQLYMYVVCNNWERMQGLFSDAYLESVCPIFYIYTGYEPALWMFCGCPKQMIKAFTFHSYI